MKQHKKTIAWFILGLVLMIIVVWRAPRAELAEAISSLQWGWAVAAVGVNLTAQSLLAVRWVLLLRVQRVEVPVIKAVQLTFLGLFYNNLMPGSVGGDLLKGWYITRHSDPERRVEAATTVFVDRLAGLVGMILIGALASLFVGSELVLPVGQWRVQVRFLIWTMLLGLILVFVLFFSRRVRTRMRLNWLLEKLPFKPALRKIDQAIRANRHHPMTLVAALGLTATLQSLSVLAIWLFTQSLGMEGVRFIECLILMSIIWLLSAAVPVPGGLGVVENLFIPFFAEAAAGQMGAQTGQAQAAALALLNRAMLIVCAIPGALVPVFGGHLPRLKDLEEDSGDLEDIPGEPGEDTVA